MAKVSSTPTTLTTPNTPNTATTPITPTTHITDNIPTTTTTAMGFPGRRGVGNVKATCARGWWESVSEAWAVGGESAAKARFNDWFLSRDWQERDKDCRFSEKIIPVKEFNVVEKEESM